MSDEAQLDKIKTDLADSKAANKILKNQIKSLNENLLSDVKSFISTSSFALFKTEVTSRWGILNRLETADFILDKFVSLIREQLNLKDNNIRQLTFEIEQYKNKLVNLTQSFEETIDHEVQTQCSEKIHNLLTQIEVLKSEKSVLVEKVSKFQKSVLIENVKKGEVKMSLCKIYSKEINHLVPIFKGVMARTPKIICTNLFTGVV